MAAGGQFLSTCFPDEGLGSPKRLELKELRARRKTAAPVKQGVLKILIK